MKKIILALVIIPVTFIGNVQARSLVFNLDEVDSITFNEKNFLIEDFRDGYVSIKGIDVDDESVRNNSNPHASILLKNGTIFKLSKTIIETAISSGGDMGGGGK